MKNRFGFFQIFHQGRNPLVANGFTMSSTKLMVHKPRLIAKGFPEREGIEYEEIFAPIEKMNIIFLVLALATQFGWKIYQMGVKNPFLSGDLEEEMYITQL